MLLLLSVVYMFLLAVSYPSLNSRTTSIAFSEGSSESTRFETW